MSEDSPAYYYIPMSISLLSGTEWDEKHVVGRIKLKRGSFAIFSFFLHLFDFHFSRF